MTTPTIHNNGTPRTMLLDGYMEAREAVLAAIVKLQSVEFNPRDYYPQGPDAWNAARDEHYARLKMLHAVANELELLLVAIVDAP